MHRLLSKIDSAEALRTMSLRELGELADEIREVLCNLLSTRSAHFASNLGVVELTLALHSVFDFRRDRLIWDTGHQIYPHKLVTGRYHEFSTIRMRNGLMGYPNPAESEYDLFMTGHAGASVSTMLGMRSGDDLLGQSDRHAVAVIGDGALPSGIVFEAMNNAAGSKQKLLVILNDNKMSICPRVGGVASYLDRLRTNSVYTGLKTEVVKALNRVPVFGDPAERFLAQLKEGIKAGLCGGMLFEELGFRYIGPIDGHNIGLMRKYLEMVKSQPGPVLLHVVTEKGRGFQPAESDPVYFHTPPVFENQNGQVVVKASGGSKAYTNIASASIAEAMRRDPRVTVMTAAMCQGNKLETVRDEFPDRFFDVGICESHAVAFAAGQAKAGLRPIVDIYSTFLQRSFDQIFQEVALQDLPVTFMMDRAGLTGPDGPTHHGVFDLGYMRMFPNMVVMAPGDAFDLCGMVELALRHDSPCSIRYPKASATEINGDQREASARETRTLDETTPTENAIGDASRSTADLGGRAAVELGRAEVYRWGRDGMIVCCGTLLADCLTAARTLRDEGLDVGVVNARFVKPLDADVMRRVLSEGGFVVTVEEGALMTGFGSALLEFAAEEGLPAAHVRRLGLPDRFIEHGERAELLADLQLDAVGIARACRECTEQDFAGQPSERRGEW